MESLRLIAPPVLALAAVLAIDSSSRLRGLQAPGLVVRELVDGSFDLWTRMRRAIALGVFWCVFWVGVFDPIRTWGLEPVFDPESVRTPQLFLLHVLFVFSLIVWYALGFAALPAYRGRKEAGWWNQLGFKASHLAGEIGIGVVVGMGAWIAVLGILLFVGSILWWAGGESLLPSEPPPIIPWIATLPLGVRLAVSLSAGVVEETFFRGFLQPRIGIAFSTGLFVLAHASYAQPLMLLGVGILSLIYGGLVWWRRTIWPAIVAHFLFDAVQLTVVIPGVLRWIEETKAGGTSTLAGVVQAMNSAWF